MHTVRFTDPAGATRVGEWLPTREEIRFGGQSYRPDEVDILAPCEPTKIMCIGLNYADHAAETGSEVPDRPKLFMKGPNAVASHGDTIPLLAGKERIDHEAELAVIIGEQCRHVDAADAMDVVAGFTCMNDISNRDDQRIEENWIRGKAFDHAAPLGPVMATPEEVPDDATISLRVNGERRQASSRDQFIFDIPALIEEITTYVTLEPGDVISTGTPEGVSPLEPGDSVAISIEGIGTLEHDIGAPL